MGFLRELHGRTPALATARNLIGSDGAPGASWVRAVQAGRRGAAEKDAEAAFAAAPGVLDLVVVVAHVDFGVVEDCYWGFGLSGVREV
jgi:hypothetical protein